MHNVGTYSVEQGIGIITIDAPPVNALSIDVRRALDEGLCLYATDDRVRAILLICGGRTFFSGADVGEIGRPIQEPSIQQIFDDIERIHKPVIAAMHGAALGGGYELALVCDYRIATPTARMGLPQVKFGLVPGAGGTQRLPRLVGVETALDLITAGRAVAAPEARELGMIDALAQSGDLRADAIAFAREIVAEKRPLARISARDDKLYPMRGHHDLFARYRREHANAWRGRNAPGAAVTAIEAAVEMPFELGIQVETDLFIELRASTESAALRHMFFAERETAKIPDIPADTPVLPVKNIGVVGAGTMGTGIAINFLNIAMPVTIVEREQGALDQGVATIRRHYEAAVARGRLNAEQARTAMALLTPALSPAALADADLVIEAVYESMAVKQEVFARLDATVRPDTILATNTSFLDINAIAATTRHPRRVIGMHFFAPAQVRRLLEVVRGAQASKTVVHTAMQLGRKLGKLPILAGACHGFIANRLMMAQMAAAEHLALSGTPPATVDKAAWDFGFAMGPFQTIDLVGLDVLGRDDDQRSLRGDLVAQGRLGQKRNGGFYDYDDKRQPTPSPIAAQVIADFAAWRGIPPDKEAVDAEIIARLLYPVVNEGARILAEGIALRPGDIDIAATLGFNWPAHTGGPMFWADTVGLENIVAGLREQHIEPAPLLVERAAAGGRLGR